MNIDFSFSADEMKIVEKLFLSIEEKWGSGYLTTQRRNTPNIYNYYPYLFTEIFNEIDSDLMQKFTVSARLFSSSVFLMDSILDGDVRDLQHLTNNTLRCQAAQFEAYQMLSCIFPTNTFFWQKFSSFMQDFTSSILEEKRIESTGYPFSSFGGEDIRRIVVGKNGMSRAVIAGLSELSKQEYFYLPLIKSTEYFYFARQICDDLLDFKRDIIKKKISTAIFHMSIKNPAIYSVNSDKNFLEEITREFYYGGHAETLLEQAIAELHHATLAIEGLPQSGWHNAIVNLQNECVSIKNDITKIILKNLQRS